MAKIMVKVIISVALMCAALLDFRAALATEIASNATGIHGCSIQAMHSQWFKYGRRVTETQEDELLVHFTPCSEPWYAAKYCLLGPQQVMQGIAENDVSFIFVGENTMLCAERYREVNSSNHIVRYRNSQGEPSDIKYIENGTSFILSEAAPFFVLAEKYMKTPLSTIYMLNECLQDTVVHSFISVSQGVFGLRKGAVLKGSVLPPRPDKTLICTLSQVRLALQTHTTDFGEKQAHAVLTSLTVCQKKAPNYCVFGIQETVDAFRDKKLNAVVVSDRSGIVTNEYVNSHTGERIYRHGLYTERFPHGELIINGVFYHFSRCLPLLDYLSEFTHLGTAVVRVSKCMRDFDDVAFNSKYDGIAGILRYPSHREPVNMSSCARPAPVILGSSLPCDEFNINAASLHSTTLSTATVIMLVFIIFLIAVIIGQFVALIKLIKKSTMTDEFELISSDRERDVSISVL